MWASREEEDGEVVCDALLQTLERQIAELEAYYGGGMPWDGERAGRASQPASRSLPPACPAPCRPATLTTSDCTHGHACALCCRALRPGEGLR